MKIILSVLLLVTPYLVKAQQYQPINDGSKIHFVIKNIGINTGGYIAGMEGSIKFNPAQIVASFFDITVAVKTLDTNNGKRDEHLKKKDYFDAEKYPTIRLISTCISKGADAQHFLFKGNLTIKNVTKPIVFVFTAVQKTAAWFLQVILK